MPFKTDLGLLEWMAEHRGNEFACAFYVSDRWTRFPLALNVRKQELSSGGHRYITSDGHRCTTGVTARYSTASTSYSGLCNGTVTARQYFLAAF